LEGPKNLREVGPAAGSDGWERVRDSGRNERQGRMNRRRETSGTGVVGKLGSCKDPTPVFNVWKNAPTTAKKAPQALEILGEFD